MLSTALFLSALFVSGDSKEPHPCIGKARRMMVPRRHQQAAVMIEAVSNHTPEVSLIGMRKPMRVLLALDLYHMACTPLSPLVLVDSIKVRQGDNRPYLLHMRKRPSAMYELAQACVLAACCCRL